VAISPGAITNKALVNVWTGVSVLVGSVVAVAFGQPESALAAGGWLEKLTPQTIVRAYAWAYMAVGIGAVVYWLVRPARTPPLIENAATTFLGLLLPIVSAFLRPDARFF
jgi:hypothetical protein